MFVALQLPLADTRPFLRVDTRKLVKPRFTYGVDPDQPEFLRSFGLLEERQRNAPADWPAEDVYCEAARGIRFAESPGAVFEYPDGARFDCVFRRFLSNGEAVARIEIGLARRPRRTIPPLSGDQIVELARNSLRIATRVPDGNNGWAEHRFIDSGSAVAKHVLRSTTKWKDTPPGFAVEDSWIDAGRVLAMIELYDGEAAEMPRDATRVDLGDRGFALYHLSFRRKDSYARAWVLRITEDAERPELRDVRLHLFRLHAEREVLKSVLDSLDRGDIPLPKTQDEARPLLTYLEKATGFLERTKVYGHPQSALLEVAYGYEDLVKAGQRASLRESLSVFRQNLADRLDDATTGSGAATGGQYPF